MTESKDGNSKPVDSLEPLKLRESAIEEPRKNPNTSSQQPEATTGGKDN